MTDKNITTFKDCYHIDATEWTVRGKGVFQTFPTYNEAREFVDAQLILKSPDVPQQKDGS